MWDLIFKKTTVLSSLGRKEDQFKGLGAPVNKLICALHIGSNAAKSRVAGLAQPTVSSDSVAAGNTAPFTFKYIEYSPSDRGFEPLPRYKKSPKTLQPFEKKNKKIKWQFFEMNRDLLDNERKRGEWAITVQEKVAIQNKGIIALFDDLDKLKRNINMESSYKWRIDIWPKYKPIVLYLTETARICTTLIDSRRTTKVCLDYFNNCSGIYMIENKITKKRYIGKSTNLLNRIKNYFDNNFLKSKPTIINRALIKFKLSNFKFTILEYCDTSVLSEREQFYIDKYKPQYNIRKTVFKGGLDDPN